MERTPASTAWMVLGASIVAYEVLAPEGQLLSEAADRFIERHKRAGQLAILGAGAVITGHLANTIPARIDPIHQGLKVLKGVRA